MIRTIAALVLTAVVLCGCVLQSRKPIYSDSQSALALGAQGGTGVISSWRDGKWQDERETAEITTAGNHYEATTGSSTMTMSFVPLDGRWHVLQAVETGKPPVYMLAQVEANTTEVYTLACTDLKKNADLSAWIDYEGDDCFIKTDAPAKALFTALEKIADAPSSRLTILR